MRQRKWNGRLFILWSVVLLGMMSGMLFALRAFARLQPPRVAPPDAAAIPPIETQEPGTVSDAGSAQEETVSNTVETGASDTPGEVQESSERDFIEGDGSDSCPVDYPIKANERSGIYHLPGDLAYDRTVPTYCYQSEAAAERDGYRHAYR